MTNFEKHAKYDFAKKISYDVMWPGAIDHEGKHYYLGGIRDKRKTDECPTAVFWHINGNDAIVLALDGEISIYNNYDG